jgi:hypothetical protein
MLPNQMDYFVLVSSLLLQIQFTCLLNFIEYHILHFITHPRHITTLIILLLINWITHHAIIHLLKLLISVTLIPTHYTPINPLHFNYVNLQSNMKAFNVKLLFNLIIIHIILHSQYFPLLLIFMVTIHYY